MGWGLCPGMDFSVSAVEPLDSLLRESSRCHVLLHSAGTWSGHGMHKPPGTEQQVVLLTPAVEAADSGDGGAGVLVRSARCGADYGSPCRECCSANEVDLWSCGTWSQWRYFKEDFYKGKAALVFRDHLLNVGPGSVPEQSLRDQLQ